MINAVGYTRFSSNNQKCESLDAQRRSVKYYASQEGYNIIRFYEDKALSGKTATKRTAFQQMMADAKTGEFQAVIVHKLDRFSRDVGDSLQYEKLLSDYNVELVSVMEKLDSTPTGVLMKTIIAGINSFYVQNLAMEVIKGLKENAYQSKFTGGKPPLGYDIVNLKYVINEHEAEAVRMIYQLYDEGFGYGEIINKLNAQGYQTKSGNSFGKNSLYDLIRNERYKGVFVYNRHTKRRSNGSRTRSYKKEEDIIRIPNGIPAIVSEELWKRCNDRASIRSTGSISTANEMYLLTGLIYCGECGAKMYGNARYPAPNRAKLITYRCSGRQMKKCCDNKEIKRDDLENFVINQLQQYLLNDQLIPEITAQLNVYIQKNASNPQEVANYQARLKELQHNKENLIDAISKTGLNDTFTQKLSEIETEMASIAAMLEKSEKSQDLAVVTEEMVTQYIGSFKDYVLKRDKPQIKRMLASYVKRVDVFKDKITVTFKIAVPDALGNPVAISFEKEADKDSIRIA